jgi:hypothetical protein
MGPMAPPNPTGNPNFNLKKSPDRNKSGPELPDGIHQIWTLKLKLKENAGIIRGRSLGSSTPGGSTPGCLTPENSILGRSILVRLILVRSTPNRGAVKKTFQGWYLVPRDFNVREELFSAGLPNGIFLYQKSQF